MLRRCCVLVAIAALCAGCGGGGGGTAGSCSPSGSELEIAASDLVFSKDCLAAPAGEAFTIAFDNQDQVEHNVAIYTDDSASDSLFEGKIVTGPTTVTYEVSPIEAGTYFFRCDVHPATMTGSFVAG